MTSENNGMYMPVAPAYGYGYGGGNDGFGGNSAWWLLILLIALGGWGNNGFGGGFGGGFFPWMMGGQMNTNNDVQRGFDHSAVMTGLNGINNAVTTGFGNVQTALCSGFSGINATVNGAQNAIAQQLYGNEIASLNRSFAEQTANAQGFNGVNSGIADVRYTLASEGCATRANSTQNTQGILNAINGGIQSIKDQLCQDKIDAKNDEIATLRQQIAMKDLAASQTAQNAFIAQGFSNEVDQLYNRLNSCPVPTTPVYGRTPIFTCGCNSTGCGCNGGFMN